MKKHTLLTIIYVVFLSLYGFNSVAQVTTPTTSNCSDPAGGCDTIGIAPRISPWRVGGFIGPAVAFCGSWEATFNSDKYRDKALFNGIGFNALLNADYYFIRSRDPKEKKRFELGAGAVAGLQNFFFRKDINTFIDRIVADAGTSDAVIRKGASEDHYFAVGPVANFNFTKKPRSLFLEASIRGGIFRSTPATIFVYDRATQNNIYSVTATDKKYHAGLLATLGVFLPSKNGLWAWGVEAIGFRTKMDYIFPGATIYPYQRKHGGFSAGLAMRRNFIHDVPVKKEPTPPIICVAPDMDIRMGGKSIKGFVFATDDSTTNTEPIVITWKSRTVLDSTKTENFTARIHQLNEGMDKVIAQTVCTNDSVLAWPAEYLNSFGRPVQGQYYVTVQSQQLSACASCTSEASTSGFSVQVPIVRVIKDTTCYKQCNLEVYAYKRIRLKDRVIYGKTTNKECTECICPISTKPRWTYKYFLLGKVQKDNCDPASLNLNEEIEKGNIAIPEWANKVYTAVETIVVGKCDEPQGRTKINYSAPVKKGKVGTFIKVK